MREKQKNRQKKVILTERQIDKETAIWVKSRKKKQKESKLIGRRHYDKRQTDRRKKKERQTEKDRKTDRQT